MPKTTKGTKKTGDKKQSRQFYALHPWQCKHGSDSSEITAYVEASGKWETVALIPSTSGASAEHIANFIVHLVNANQQNKDLLQDAMNALEAVMNDGLNFTTEQTAEHVIINIRQVVK